MKKMSFPIKIQSRWFATQIKVQLNDGINSALETGEMKSRHHPGMNKPRNIEYPKWILPSIKKVLEGRNLIEMSSAASDLGNYLNGRHSPMTKEKYQICVDKTLKRMYPDKDTSDLQINDLDPSSQRKANTIFKQFAHNWQPVDYTEKFSLFYLIERSIPEYTVLYRILNQIHLKDQQFKPQTLFDFGSGIGTVSWVASQFWSESLKEYLCLDTSSAMHELSEKLIATASPQIEKVHYRQFLPISSVPYDIVVCAYSLFELPSDTSRLDVILNLWKKTKRYLVIVEQGTNAGFKLINEAREFILNHLSVKEHAHIFAPCVHEFTCPRYLENNFPCNFEVKYYSLPLTNTSRMYRERFSYVVFKKGKRSQDDEQWPRIVQPVLKRSKHVICRTCTSSGKLEEQIFTASKHKRNLYRCAKSSIWGDQIPVQSIDQVVEEEGSENTLVDKEDQ